MYDQFKNELDIAVFLNDKKSKKEQLESFNKTVLSEIDTNQEKNIIQKEELVYLNEHIESLIKRN